MLTMIEQSRVVLVPRNNRYETLAAAAYEEFGMDFPPFEEGKESVQFADREYKWVEDTDIPTLVEIGLGDIGLVGLDVCIESTANVEFRTFGEPFAYFDVFTDSNMHQVRTLLNSESAQIPVATTWPRLLGSSALHRNINLTPVNKPIEPSLFTKIIPVGSNEEGVLRLRELRPAVVWNNTEQSVTLP